MNDLGPGVVLPSHDRIFLNRSCQGGLP